MSTYEVFSSIKDLTDECDKLLDQIRTALLVEDAEKIISFSTVLKEMMPRIREVLIQTKELVIDSDKDDKLVRFIDVYYRMMVLVNLPYLSMMLRDSASLLNKLGRSQEAVIALSLAEDVDSLLDTLRR